MKYLNTKPGSIEEVAANMSKYAAESEYQDMFKKELEKAGKGIGSMTPAEKKAFFNKIDSKYKAKNEETINEKKNYKRDKNFFVNDKTDTLKKMSGRQDYNKSTLTDYLAQKSNKKENDVYFDDTDLVYKSKTVLKNAETKTVDQMLKALQKEEVSQKEIDKFHTSLDKLVHKSFGHSSDEKKKEIKEEDAYQNNRFVVSGNTAKIDNANTSDKSNHVHAPNAKTAVAMYKAGVKSYKDNAEMRRKFPMAVEEAVDNPYAKDVIHKATEEVKETHSFITNKQNEKQKKVGGEKDIVDPAPSIKKESLYDSIKSVWQMSAEQLEKIKSEAKYYKKEQNKNDLKPKKIADTGSESTPVDVEPKVDYTN